MVSYDPSTHSATAYRRPPLRVMTSVESVRQVVAAGQNFRHCGWCGHTTPDSADAAPHDCEVARRIREAKRQAEAEGRRTIPHFGPRTGDPVKCVDCGRVSPAGGSHTCPGPKTSGPVGAYEVEHQLRRAALLADLRALGVVAGQQGQADLEALGD
jgi:hypothetical protein